ncbi:MAG: 50S ribosomal protein L17 [Bdellovibrionota bacterium]
MNHRNAFRKLGRTASHRRSMFRNLATSLVLHNRIETTLPKAKELKRIADKLVTLGKNDTLHTRRQAMTYLYAMNREASGNAQKWTAVHRLFTVIAPRYEGRNGGYTRVIRTRKRDGDKAQLAMIEFVEADLRSDKPEKKRKRRVVKTEAASEAAAS